MPVCVMPWRLWSSFLTLSALTCTSPVCSQLPWPSPPPLPSHHSAHFIYEYVEAYPSVAAKGHPLWNFWPNLPTSLALVVSLGVTLISQARLAPDVKDAPLNHVAAHVGVGGVMFLVVLGTLYLTVSATGWVYHGGGSPIYPFTQAHPLSSSPGSSISGHPAHSCSVAAQVQDKLRRRSNAADWNAVRLERHLP